MEPPRTSWELCPPAAGRSRPAAAARPDNRWQERRPRQTRDRATTVNETHPATWLIFPKNDRPGFAKCAVARHHILKERLTPEPCPTHDRRPLERAKNQETRWHIRD